MKQLKPTEPVKGSELRVQLMALLICETTRDAALCRYDFTENKLLVPQDAHLRHPLYMRPVNEGTLRTFRVLTLSATMNRLHVIGMSEAAVNFAIRRLEQ